MTTKQFISNAKAEVREMILRSDVDSRTIIARYTAAVAVNFTDWIGKTIPWARHETARHALVDNLRCESVHDHVKMPLNLRSHSSPASTPNLRLGIKNQGPLSSRERLFLFIMFINHPTSLTL